MATPPKPRKVNKNVSPAKTEPMSPLSHTLTIEQRSQSRGMWGIGRPKTMFIGCLYLLLIGGLAYFILEWLEIPGLNEQLDRLSGEVDRLETQNRVFADLNQELNATSQQLNDTVSELTVQVDGLEKINKDLTSVVGFLNETAGDLGESLEQITEYLASQIESNKVLVLSNLENTMRQRALNWDCNYGALFGQNEWGSDFDLAIPASGWSDVVAYVNENVLEELCLSVADFNMYLSDEYDVWNSRNLISAVSGYTTTAMDWYFPEEEEIGLSHEDWAAASFNCENLSSKFTISLVSP